MTRWSYDEVRAIYAERDRYRDLVYEVATLICQRADTTFRGECGRDGQPKEGWCVVCRAKDVEAADRERFAKDA